MKATDYFIEFVDHISKLSRNETEILRQIVIEERFPRKYVFLKEGEYCQDYFFLYSGVVGVTKLAEAEIKTINILGANCLLADFNSIKRHLPSTYSFLTLCPSVLLRIKSNEFQELCQNSLSFNRILHAMYEDTLIGITEHLQEILAYDAAERYHNFVRNKPELLNLVPQKYIASYLGITPETLSRIRNSESK